jgi:hypothetical protein
LDILDRTVSSREYRTNARARQKYDPKIHEPNEQRVPELHGTENYLQRPSGRLS